MLFANSQTMGTFKGFNEKGLEFAAEIVAPYDAELFGHWWFEGPDWINFLLRKMHHDQETVKAITVPEYLEKHPKNQTAKPVMSSWGYKGYSEVWLEGSNDWIYRHLHEGADRMVELARQRRLPNDATGGSITLAFNSASLTV